MAAPLVLVSGFGAFEKVDRNPSGEIARALAEDPPPGVRVRAVVLPVSFERAPAAWDELVRPGERPALCLGMGVAKRAGFRLERRAGPRRKLVPRPDVDGRAAHEFTREGPRLETGLDLARLLAALRARGVAEARVSRTAGGYVCERVYHHLLTRAAELRSLGIFVHVPPLRFTPIERQIEVLRWVLEESLRLARGDPQSPSTSRGYPSSADGRDTAKTRAAARKPSRSRPM